MVIFFDNLLVDPGHFECNEMFDSATVAKLGLDPYCVLLGFQDTVAVLTGFGTTLGVGDQLTVIGGDQESDPGLIKLCDNSVKKLTGSVTVQMPWELIPPEVFTFGPSKIGLCDGFEVFAFATQLGPFTGEYTWSTDLATIDTTTYTEDFLTVAADTVDPGTTVNVHCEVKNFIGVSSTEQAILQVVKENRAIPELSFVGSTAIKTVRRPVGHLRINTEAIWSSCQAQDDDAKSITFTWTISPDIAQLTSEEKSRGSLGIPYNNLVAGTTYTVTVNIAMAADATLSNSKSMTVEVLYRRMHAKVKGGSYLKVGTSQTLVLDASPSVDPEATSTTMEYAWSCAPIKNGKPKGKCLNKQSEEITFAASQKLNIAASTFKSDSRNLQFSLTIKKSEPGQATARSTTITFRRVLVDSSPPILDIFSFGVSIIQSDETIFLEGVVESEAVAGQTFNWTSPQVLGGKQLEDDTTLILEPPLVPGSTIRRWSPGTKTIVFEVTNPQTAQNPAVTGAAKIDILVNTPPSGGKFTTNAVNGAAVEFDPIKMTASHWIDDATDKKSLLYEFGYEHVEDISGVLVTTEVILRERAAKANAISSNIPKRVVNGVAQPVTLYLKIFDKDKGFTKATTTVTINAFVPPDPKVFIEARITKELGDEKKKGNGPEYIKKGGMLSDWMSTQAGLSAADKKTLLSLINKEVKTFITQVDSSAALDYAEKSSRTSAAAANADSVQENIDLLSDITKKSDMAGADNLKKLAGSINKVMAGAKAAGNAAAQATTNTRRRLLAVSTTQTQFSSAFGLVETSLKTSAANFKLTFGESHNMNNGDTQASVYRLQLGAVTKTLTFGSKQVNAVLATATTAGFSPTYSNYDLYIIGSAVDGFASATETAAAQAIQVIFKATATGQADIADNLIGEVQIDFVVDSTVCPEKTCAPVCKKFDSATGDNVATGITTTVVSATSVQCKYSALNKQVIGVYTSAKAVETTTTTTTTTTSSTASTTTTTSSSTTTTTTTTTVQSTTTTTTLAPTFTPPTSVATEGKQNSVVIGIQESVDVVLQRLDSFKAILASLINQQLGGAVRSVRTISAEDVVITSVTTDAATGGTKLEFYVKNAQNLSGSSTSGGFLDKNALLKVVQEGLTSIGTSLGLTLTSVELATQPSEDDDDDDVKIILLSVLVPIFGISFIVGCILLWRSCHTSKVDIDGTPSVPNLPDEDEHSNDVDESVEEEAKDNSKDDCTSPEFLHSTNVSQTTT